MRIWLLLLLSLCAAALAEDVAALVQDRTAIEHVYYNHRLGQKPPFDQVSPPSLIERLVKEDLHKEAALKKAYGVEATAALVEAEVQRINTTTRAPEMLAEIKAALGDDSAKFASAFAKPILVERLLRDSFENDDSLHAPVRRQIEAVRERLLAAGRNCAGVTNLLSLLKEGHSNQVSETTWQLGSRPVAKEGVADPDDMEIKKSFGPEAQIISSPQKEKDRKFYFEELPSTLQKVLRAQLREPGDVSAVIETPGGFLLYVAKEKTGELLCVAGLSLPKRGFEEWPTEQTGDKP